MVTSGWKCILITLEKATIHLAIISLASGSSAGNKVQTWDRTGGSRENQGANEQAW